MMVVFHASDLTIKCLGENVTLLERIQKKLDHSHVGTVRIDHGTIPGINDTVAVNFRGNKEICKVIERHFNFEDNVCEIWVELMDLDAPHDGSIPYTIKQ